MILERIHSLLLALPNREAEQALIAFRASAEAWDICLSVVSGSQGPVSDYLALFASQTLHACARRITLSDRRDDITVLALVSRQQALLATLINLAYARAQTTKFLCAALAALSVRNSSSIRDLLTSALQQLPQWTSVQLLLALAEEAEAFQARIGSEVDDCVAVLHTLREEVGHHVYAWLAGVAASFSGFTPRTQIQQPEQQQQQQRILLLVLVRCVGAWSRLGCLYSACCPAGAVRELLGLMLRCAHPGEDDLTSVRHEACETLGDVIEHGPDTLIRELHSPLVQLAATVAAAAAVPDGAGAEAAADSRARRPAATVYLDAVYDIVQLFSSYAAARMGDWVTAVCSGGSTAVAPTGLPQAEAAALAEVLCQLAALDDWTEGGYPVNWPAMQVLTDLALGCIATSGTSPPPPDSAATGLAGGGGAAGGDGRCPMDGANAMRHDGGGVAGVGAQAATSQPVSPLGFASGELCVPDLTLGPRPGLPAHLLTLYDNVLRAVLSCCIIWSLSDGDSCSSQLSQCPEVIEMEVNMDGGPTATHGLLRLPPECDEALRSCLQACASVVGQLRQVSTALQLLQKAPVVYRAGCRPSALQGGCIAGIRDPALWAHKAATLTAAVAAIAACGTLPSPSGIAIRFPGGVEISSGGGDDAAGAVASVTASILLAVAEHMHSLAVMQTAPSDASRTLPEVLVEVAVPLTLHYCEALTGSCVAVLQLQQLQLNAGAVPMAGRSSSSLVLPDSMGQTDASWFMCRIAEPALTGLQIEATAVMAAQALRALVAAARSVGVPLPWQLATALVESVHCLPYDAGPRFHAAEPELIQASMEASAAATEDVQRLDLFQRLLGPAVSCISEIAAAAVSSPSSSSSSRPAPGHPPLPRSHAPGRPACEAIINRRHDATLARQLRLLEAALEASSTAAGHRSGASVLEPTPFGRASPVAVVLVQQAWPALQVLLHYGTSGCFLLPLSRCLATMFRSMENGAAVGISTWGLLGRDVGKAGGGGDKNKNPDVLYMPEEDTCAPDPWVVAVLEALAGCVGRPGAKHVYEPLVAILEACVAASPIQTQTDFSSHFPMQSEERQRQRWRQAHVAPVTRIVHAVLYGRVASELATSWRAADRDPDSAECVLRLAIAAVRNDVQGAPAADTGASDVVDTAAGTTMTSSGRTIYSEAIAAAALRLAAASSGCNHRQVGATALACTCAVLEEACGRQRLVPDESDKLKDSPVAADAVAPAMVVVSTDTRGSGGGGGGGGTALRQELLAVVMQQGHLIAAGLIAALLSSSPLPRLQRVTTALVLLAIATAHCYRLEQHQSASGASAAATKAEVEACSRVLSSWIVGAASFLQMPEEDGAAVAASWAPVLAEAGVSASEVVSGASARVLHRKLRRLLREFAESRMRV